MATNGGFIIIGENIHCTRKIKRGGKRTTTTDDGREAIAFASADGTPRCLPIPETLTGDDAPPLVAHIRCAVELALSGDEDDRRLAADFVEYEARRQIEAGTHFLDVNVDEVSNDIEARNRAMEWIVPVVQAVSDRPLSIDSSAIETLAAGLEAYDADRGGRPMLNSISLERPEAVDLAVEHDCHVVALPVAESGMPAGKDDRLANIDTLVARLEDAKIARENIYVDPLVMTASTDPAAPRIVLDTISEVRAKYPRIHIAGGHSNISHGLPMRRLLNATWLILAIDAGVDAGILDPLSIRPEELAGIDREGTPFKLARDGLLGSDEFFIEFITASRDGTLADPPA